MNDCTEPLMNATAGDKVEHDWMPGFVMAVQEVRDCERDSNRYLAHSQYKITDPEGNEDWLCAYDVHEAP